MGDDEYGPATAARAKWDFVPEEPSGLALTADDELEVWPTEKGWWFARKKRGGYEGYVPRDYVRVEGRHAEVLRLVDASIIDTTLSGEELQLWEALGLAAFDGSVEAHAELARSSGG